MKWFSVILITVLSLIACQPAPVPNPPTSTPTPEPAATLGADPSPHFLVSSGVEVQLSREEWPENYFLPIAFGTALQSSDLLQVEEGEALVLCSNLKIWPISGLDSTPCSPEPGILKYREHPFFAPRGGAVQDIPYILYPRATLLLDDQPTLRWHDTGSDSYLVGIKQGNDFVWGPVEVSGDELPYPSGETPLVSGEIYQVWVQDNSVQITAAPSSQFSNIGFEVATAAEREEIANAKQQISKTDLDQAGERFAEAVYYATLPEDFSENGYTPVGDAWLIFESLAQSEDSPVIQLWRGDMLVRLGLSNEAEVAYEAALQSAEALGDLESEASARVALWCLTTDQGEADNPHKDRIVEIYQTLGQDDLEVDKNLCEQD